MQIRCPNCDGMAESPPDWSGESFTCPLCQGAVDLPSSLGLKPDAARRRAEGPAGGGDRDIQVQCPHCAAAIVASASQAGQVVACQSCGGQMQVPAAPPVPDIASAPPQDPLPEGPRQPCPYCGHEILEAAIKCRHCGEWLDPAKREQVRAAKDLIPKFQKNMKGTGLGLIGLAVLNLVFGLAMAGSPQGGPVLALWVIFAVLIILVLGGLALARKVWANYAAVVFFSLLAVLNGIGMAADANQVNTCAMLVPIAVAITSINNLKQHAQIVRAGLDPWGRVPNRSSGR